MGFDKAAASPIVAKALYGTDGLPWKQDSWNSQRDEHYVIFRPTE